MMDAPSVGMSGRELRTVKAAEAVRRRRDLPALAKVVWQAVTGFLFEDRRECWPSHARLADQCGCTDRTIRRQLSRLRAAGLLDWRRRGPGSNVFRVPRDCLTAPAEGKRPDRHVRSRPDNPGHKTGRACPPRPDTPVRVNHDTERGSEQQQAQADPPMRANPAPDAAAGASLPEDRRAAQGDLLSLRFDDATALDFARRYAPADVTGWCAEAKRRKGLRNPAGLVRSMLERGERPPRDAKAEREAREVARREAAEKAERDGQTETDRALFAALKGLGVDRADAHWDGSTRPVAYADGRIAVGSTWYWRWSALREQGFQFHATGRPVDVEEVLRGLGQHGDTG